MKSAAEVQKLSALHEKQQQVRGRWSVILPTRHELVDSAVGAADSLLHY